MADRTGERCDWCGEGHYERIGVNPYTLTLNEVIYLCTACHHEVPGYERREGGGAGARTT